MSNTNIMIVEDEGIVAKALQTKILKFGYSCTTICHSGEDAIKKAKEIHPDLILMDIFLKGKIDGIQAAELIMQEVDIPIIYLTAYANEDILQRAKLTYPFGYILKPYKEKDLEVSIRMALFKNKMEQAVKESEARYREVITSSQNGIISVDKNGTIILWNKGAENTFGFTEKESKNLSIKKLIDFEKSIESSQDALVNKILKHLGENEYIGHHKSKEIRILDISESQRLENEEQIQTFFVHDITDKKKSDIKLSVHKEQLKLINRILRHDLTNQLAFIRSSIKNYQKTDNKELLDGMYSSVNNSVQLIRKMKDLEHFLAQHQDLSSFSAREVVNQACSSLQEIPITISGDCNVLADEAIYSVFENVISNIGKHAKATNIDIQINLRGRLCEVRIADDGIGIPDDWKEKIFDENVTYGESGHTGIGLYIAKKALENYSGTIYVEDNQPKGSVFVIILRAMVNKKRI